MSYKKNKKTHEELKILAFDTSFEYSSVALQVKGEIKELSEFTPQSHTQVLLPMIDKLLQEGSLNLTDLDFLAFGHGPGSFTSVRFAVSIAQGLAFGANLPLAAISSLNAIAEEAYEKCQSSDILVAMDARMQEIYWGAYKYNSGFMQPLTKDALGKEEDIVVKKSSNWLRVGNGWKNNVDISQKELFPRAKYIAKLGYLAYCRDELISWQTALPVYLRDKVVQNG